MPQQILGPVGLRPGHQAFDDLGRAVAGDVADALGQPLAVEIQLRQHADEERRRLGTRHAEGDVGDGRLVGRRQVAELVPGAAVEQLVPQGDPRRVIDAYLASVEKSEDAQLAAATAKAVAAVSSDSKAGPAPPRPAEPARPETAQPDGELKNMFEAVEGRWGSREIEITDVALLDKAGQRSFIFHSGDPMAVRLNLTAHAPATDFVFGLSLFNADGVCCYGTNTFIEEMDPERLEGQAEVTLSIDSLDLVEGTYKLDVAVHTCDGYPYDYHRLLYTFRVKSRTPDFVIYRPHHLCSFSPTFLFKPNPKRVSGSKVWPSDHSLRLATNVSASGPEFALPQRSARTSASRKSSGDSPVTTGHHGYFVGRALPKSAPRADASQPGETEGM